MCSGGLFLIIADSCSALFRAVRAYRGFCLQDNHGKDRRHGTDTEKREKKEKPVPRARGAYASTGVHSNCTLADFAHGRRCLNTRATSSTFFLPGPASRKQMKYISQARLRITGRGVCFVCPRNHLLLECQYEKPPTSEADRPRSSDCSAVDCATTGAIRDRCRARTGSRSTCDGCLAAPARIADRHQHS